ncbi:Acg family FMN-binding oxidoreductase [Microbacterium sp.]|uniref:Acg family FMN-binding oxidoreductase n=1 Tax=Microbacterium sp. TaxID=51671 RepID=UPI003C762C60
MLKGVAIGGGAVVLAGAAGIGVRGAVNGVWSQSRGAPYELWQHWQDAEGTTRLVAAATLAANPHNIQPWTFAVTDGTIDLYADPARIMPVNDSDGRERMAGFGCALENLAVAARVEGLTATIAHVFDGDHVAHVDLAAGPLPSARERALADAIANRHSNRGRYTAQPVDAADLDALTADALPEVSTGAELVWITDPGAMAMIGDLYVEATQAIVDDEEMSVESYTWFRNDRADIDRHRDGLTLDCQGLDAFTLFAAKILPAQSRSDGDAFWVKATRTVHTATAHAYGIVRVPSNTDPAARLVGGRLLQHAHLAATASGLGLQHMNQVTERIARDASLGVPDRFGTRWADAVGIPTDEILLAVRVGHSERTPLPSPRRALTAVTAG